MARYGRGRPAHPFISAGILIVAVSDSDSFGTTVEAASVAAAVPSTDAFGTVVEATSLVARFTSTDAISSLEANTTAAEPVEADVSSGLEATTIVASLSHSDTGGGLESGAPPPATLATADTAGSLEAERVATSSADIGSGTENTPSIAFSDTETMSSAEDQDVDTFGGDSKLGQDTYSAASASTIVATVSSSDSFSGFDTQPYIGVNDDEPLTSIDKDSGTGIGIGILADEAIASAELGAVRAISSDAEPLTSTEGDPSIILLISPALANDSIQIRDNTVTPIGLFEDDPVSIVDAQSATRIASADTMASLEATSIVASRTEADSVAHTETEESPDVNLPTGLESLHYVEAGAPATAYVSSSDTVSLVDTENVNRGTPTSRLFVVEAEVRLKVIEAVTRVLEIPAEVRVLVVAGGFG